MIGEKAKERKQRKESKGKKAKERKKRNERNITTHTHTHISIYLDPIRADIRMIDVGDSVFPFDVEAEELLGDGEELGEDVFELEEFRHFGAVDAVGEEPLAHQPPVEGNVVQIHVGVFPHAQSAVFAGE